ncbi:MAG: hypothetical protein SVY15_02760 [Halobacteriota archaeon]|nr:hypothetical protein [Halobacteriota archaeon]
MYLIVAKYSDDAERKRVEYSLERWKSSMNISKPEGIVSIAEGDGIEELLEDLYARISKENIKVYSLREASLEVEENEKQIKVDLEGEMETIERFVGFVMAKIKAVVKYESSMGKLYEVYTKKGGADIETVLNPSPGKVTVSIRIKGYGDVTELVYDKIVSELEFFKGV